MAERTRLHRRLAGMLRKRLHEARLGELDDPRDERGQRWKLPTLLHAALLGLCAGCRSLGEVEQLTSRLSAAVRRWFGIGRRVPDTTLRDLLCQLRPAALRAHLHAVVRAAVRRKALSDSALPFGVVSLDGKGTALPSCDDFYAQRQSQSEGALVGVVRTVTSVLVSHPARPCLDVLPIPAATNEMGIFETALHALWQVYGGTDLFRLVSYDAGACSLDNASLVRQLGLHYLFGLTAAQPTLHGEAQRLLGTLGAEQAVAQSEDSSRTERVVRRLHLTEEMSGFGGWEHLRTVLRVESETFAVAGRRTAYEERYFLASLPLSRLSPAHWLLLVRLHWGVETAHQILDVAFAEDDHPWIESVPRAAVVVAILRRIAYDLLTLFRSVTQRAETNRQLPWRSLMRDLYIALVAATAQELAGLRRHLIPPVPD